MLKEIQEQPRAVADTLRGHLVGGQIVLDEQRVDRQDLRDVDKVFVVACGTAYHSGLIAQARDRALDPDSGRGRDGLRVPLPRPGAGPADRSSSRSASPARPRTRWRRCGTPDQQRAKVLSICNTNGAQIPRESDAVLYTHAGPEIGVAATKTFTAQIAAVQLVGLALAQARGTKYGDEIGREYAALAAMPELIAQTLRRGRAGPRTGPGDRAARRPCCSSAGTWATRSRWRARSSSRSWRTCTPRASRPAS